MRSANRPPRKLKTNTIEESQTSQRGWNKTQDSINRRCLNWLHSACIFWRQLTIQWQGCLELISCCWEVISNMYIFLAPSETRSEELVQKVVSSPIKLHQSFFPRGRTFWKKMNRSFLFLTGGAKKNLALSNFLRNFHEVVFFFSVQGTQPERLTMPVLGQNPDRWICSQLWLRLPWFPWSSKPAEGLFACRSVSLPSKPPTELCG